MERRNQELLFLAATTAIVSFWNPVGMDLKEIPQYVVAVVMYAVPSAVLTVLISRIYFGIKYSRDENKLED